jgi:hypothetical protein
MINSTCSKKNFWELLFCVALQNLPFGLYIMIWITLFLQVTKQLLILSLIRFSFARAELRLNRYICICYESLIALPVSKMPFL